MRAQNKSLKFENFPGYLKSVTELLIYQISYIQSDIWDRNGKAKLVISEILFKNIYKKDSLFFLVNTKYVVVEKSKEIVDFDL